MSDGKKRTVHSAEFKAKVGMEAVRGVKTLNEIGQQYGVHPVVVGQWKRGGSGWLDSVAHSLSGRLADC